MLSSAYEILVLFKEAFASTGWYIRVAQSKDLAKRSLVGMEHPHHAFPTASAWHRFGDTLAVAATSHSHLEWKDKEAQAWILHRVVHKENTLVQFSAMKKIQYTTI